MHSSSAICQQFLATVVFGVMEDYGDGEGGDYGASELCQCGVCGRSFNSEIIV